MKKIEPRCDDLLASRAQTRPARLGEQWRTRAGAPGRHVRADTPRESRPRTREMPRPLSRIAIQMVLATRSLALQPREPLQARSARPRERARSAVPLSPPSPERVSGHRAWATPFSTIRKKNAPQTRSGWGAGWGRGIVIFSEATGDWSAFGARGRARAPAPAPPCGRTGGRAGHVVRRRISSARRRARRGKGGVSRTRHLSTSGAGSETSLETSRNLLSNLFTSFFHFARPLSFSCR